MPAPVGAAVAVSGRHDKPEGDTHHDQADAHADQPGEQQLAASKAVDEGNRNQEVASTLTPPIAHVVTVVCADCVTKPAEAKIWSA